MEAVEKDKILKSRKVVISFSSIALLVILFPLIIDQVNGFLQKEAGVNISVSQLVKFGYMTAFFFLMLLYCKISRMIIIVSGFVLSIPLLLNIFSHKMIFSSFFADLVFIFKLLTFPMFFLFFYEYGKNNKFLLSEKILDKAITLIFYMVFFALILSLLGFGLPMYDDENIKIGHKGYFIAGNQLSSLFIVIYSFYLFKILRDRTIRYVIPVIFFALICAVLMTTKTTLLSFVLVTFSVPMLKYLYDGGTITGLIKKNIKLLVSFFFLIFTGLTAVFFMFREQIENYYDKLVFGYERAGTLVTFLLSARNERYAHSFKLFSEYSMTEKILGTGWTFPQHFIGMRLFGFGHAETDWLDLLVAHGFLGVILIYFFWISVLVFTLRKYRSRTSSYSVPAIISMFLLISNTALSGHIVYSALIGMYLAYFVSALFIKEGELK